MTPQPPDVRVYMVRHGETAWSRSGQHTGRTDLPLTEPGEAEAKALSPWLRGIHFGHVLTSPLRRARRTCELAGLGRTVAVVADLEKWDYGTYEGLSSSEIQQDRPGWSVYRDGAPAGETPGDVSTAPITSSPVSTSCTAMSPSSPTARLQLSSAPAG